jgi:hypothetical protein
MATLNPLQKPIETTIALGEKPLQGTLHRFVQLAVRGLRAMFDEQRQLFCYSLNQTETGMQREGLSQRYTMMCLMGLHRLEQSGTPSPFNKESILQALFSDLSWVEDIGDLGVLLWTCAIVCPERLDEVEKRMHPESAMSRFRAARQGITMEVAWFLTGLCYWAQIAHEKLPTIQPIAIEAFQKLIKNQGARGFYGHLSIDSGVTGMARGRTGSFADQVYPIYAMAQMVKAFQHDEAAKLAQRTAFGICEEQGPRGQWWWHYDAPAGRVTDGYPVFSVHQHAMAPFTLFSLGEAIHYNFDSWINKGVRWINFHNELEIDMEAEKEAVIWRCIQRNRRPIAKYLKAGFGKFSDQVQVERADNLNVLRVCRPYELGWLLYAWAGRIV